ncbi:Cytochrome P450 monooxygenase fsdH [Lachnellula suecica]|uniref:Cytochrome P450 monooxygenase fsdH n=1 Tax=Lachnellula suecica TaxID=602035 RepID=A0A8T9C0X3_9HELO|nr:Cytochrome P450 monooxygenase fsdH [Lachnellula suecica]
MGYALIIFATVIAVASTHYVYRAWSLERVQREQGCRPAVRFWSKDPFFGFDFQMAIHLNIPSLFQYHKKLGKTFYVSPFNNISTICTIAVDNIQAVNSGKEWGIQPLRLPGMEDFCGRGFLTTDGDIWHHSRKILKPSFSKHNILDTSVLSAEVEKLFLDVPEGGQTVDLQPYFHNMFLRTLLSFLLGVHPSEEHDGAPYPSETFIEAFHTAEFRTMFRIALGRFWALAPQSKYIESCEVVHKYLDHYVEHALEKGSGLPAMDNKKVPTKQSLINDLAAQTDDRESIRSQILQAMLASLETTPALLGNTIFLLSRHPQYWRQMREEVLQAGCPLGYESLLNFKLLQNILSETLRLYPIFPLLARVALTDTTLPVGGGFDQRDHVYVPKGSHVVMSYFALHRDSSVFGDDVEEFRPDRWETIRPEQWQFMAFGGGNRACLGQSKALFEAAYVLARISAVFGKLESRDSAPWKGDLKLSCKSANGCKVALYKE